MKKLLSLVMTAALIFGVITVSGTEANAAKRYGVAARDEVADHYVTLSADKPVKGSTITAEKMEITGSTLEFVNENGGLGKVGYRVYEVYEYKYENGEYLGADAEEFFYNLSDRTSITHTISKDCLVAYGAWAIKSEEDEYPMDISFVISWMEDGKVLGGLPDTSDYDIELSPVSDVPTPAPVPTPEVTPTPAPEVTPAPAPSTTELSATPTPGKTYKVVSGDNLWMISKKAYNNGNLYMNIFNANTNILKDPAKIYVGQVLVIPAI